MIRAYAPCKLFPTFHHVRHATCERARTPNADRRVSNERARHYGSMRVSTHMARLRSFRPSPYAIEPLPVQACLRAAVAVCMCVSLGMGISLMWYLLSAVALQTRYARFYDWTRWDRTSRKRIHLSHLTVERNWAFSCCYTNNTPAYGKR